MDAKTEIKKFVSFPMLLIGSGSFVGVIGWLGLAQAAESIIFFIGSSLLSFSGSMATLCGLMSLERAAPSKHKVRKLKLDILKDIKISYPSYIITLEKLRQKYQELYKKSREIRAYCIEFRQHIRKQRSRLGDLEKLFQEKLKDNSPMIDNDSADGIAKKILWSEKQIQLTGYYETLEKLADFFSTADTERYRTKLSHINGDLKQLGHGIKFYRELMILCNQTDSNYDDIIYTKQKVEKVDNLMVNQENRLEELRTEMDTKCEEAKMELSLFQQQLDDFIEDDESNS